MESSWRWIAIGIAVGGLLAESLRYCAPVAQRHLRERDNAQQRPCMEQTSIGLPYFSHTCPAPLPSNESIHAASVLKRMGTTRVVKYSEQYVVKYGHDVDPAEGENMLFVRQHTTVPVPEVYAIYRDQDCTYIVMEYIAGDTLASIWTKIDESRKSCITTLLHNYMEELRGLPSPGYFGTIGRRPLLESMFWTGKSTPSVSGPFQSESQLNDGLIQKYTLLGGHESKASFYERTLSQVFRGHQPVFTHADFQRKNIIIRTDIEDNISVTLIDWEKSGWLPSYWEFAKAMLAYDFRDDWDKWLSIVLKPYRTEYPYLVMMFLDIWS